MWADWFSRLREDEVLVFIAIARKKYNPKLKSEQVVFREIATPNNYQQKFNKLKTLIHNYPSNANPEDYALYLSFNPRSVIKALYLLEKQMSLWKFSMFMSGKLSDYLRHLKKLDREFISCLQKPESRSRRWFFLIDIDDPSKLSAVQDQINNLGIKIEEKVKTKNGFHILVKPFNIQLWQPIENVEIIKDGVFHIYHPEARSRR